MDIRQQYVQELQTFGELFLKGFGNDFDKATEALGKSNIILADNPRIIPMLADEGNQKQISEIITFVESGKGNLLSVFNKVQKLGKKLKI